MALTESNCVVRSCSALLCCAVVIFATTEITRAETNSLLDGSRALIFQMSSDVRLSAFEGSTISLKKHTSASGAWRLGLTLSAYTQNDESDESFVFDTLLNPAARDEDRDNLSFSATLERLRYLVPERSISPYYGFGPTVGFAWSKTTAEYTTPSTLRIQDVEHQSLSVGLRGAVGVEWFPHERLSFLAQYASELIYSWSKSDVSDLRVDIGTRTFRRSSQNRFDWRVREVRLGVSAYW